MTRATAPFTFMLAIMAACAAGCRPADPPESYNRDLGTEGQVLLPITSVRTVAKIANGQSDWLDFRDPNKAPPPANTTADTAPGVPALETEIREFIAEYNEAAADPEASADDLLEYYAEQQQDAMRPIMETSLTVRHSLQEIRAELESKLPDEQARIRSALDSLDSNMQPAISADSLEIISNTKVQGTENRGAQSVNYSFVLVEGDWYIEHPDAEGLAGLKPVLESNIARYQGMLDGLKTGTTSPSEVLQMVEDAVKQAAARTAQRNANDDSTQPDDDDPEDADPEDENDDDDDD